MLTNVSWARPPGNKIELFFPKGQPNEHIQHGIEKLHRLCAETRPKAILACGNTALWALTGHREITERRGSIYAYEGIPVVACLHPAAVLREAVMANVFARDIDRFVRVSRGENLKPPMRVVVLNPSDEECAALYAESLRAELLAVDIENSGAQLSCVGFSPRLDYTVCIPADTAERVQWIKLILGSSTPKVFHNAPYDVPYLLHRTKVEVGGVIHDTLAMSQALNPEMPRSLAALTSLYTYEPYYKDWFYTEDQNVFWRYNAMDAAVTREVAGVLLEKLAKHDLMATYERTVRVLPHAFAMSIRGMKYDATKVEEVRARVERDQVRWQKILDGRAGKPINVYSSPQVCNLLYDDLELPIQYAEGSGGVRRQTSGEKALISLYPRVSHRPARQIMRALLKVRGHRKLVSSYLNTAAGADGRVRTSFNPAGTETGRWSASKFLITEGTNLQTVPLPWKPCFVADEGHVLWIADYSQIEARISSWLAGDEASIKVFEAGGDIHKYNASLIFEKPLEAITGKERQIAKSTVHLLNYGGGTGILMQTVNERALDTGVWLTEKMAARVRMTYLDTFERMIEWQEHTWETVRTERTLVNPFGRRRIFLGPTRGAGYDHTKKEALAFVPQSTVPDMMNEALIRLRTTPPVEGCEVILQIHDALMGQMPMERVEAGAKGVIEAMAIPLTINGRVLIVPVELKIGTRWSEMKVWATT